MPSFETTNWSVVLAVGAETTVQSRTALARLCETYWQPIYHFIRADGRSIEDAQDLTQEFLSLLIEKNYLANFEKRDAKFRSFLLVALRHFLYNDSEKKRAEKRGGKLQLVSQDAERAEDAFRASSRNPATPDVLYDRQWAASLIDSAFAQLKSEYEKRGKGDLFEALSSAIQPAVTVPYAEISGRTGLSEGAVKVAIHRLRKRYRETLRFEVAQTLAIQDDEQVEVELSQLMEALKS